MPVKLPYVSVPSTMVKILNKMKDASTPDRFTQDFLETKLGFKGGNARQFIPLAKKLGLLNTDGSPTELYKKFRNESTTKAAIAAALKIGYKEVFERNEYASELTKDKFKGLVVEITGLESKNKIVQLTCLTFEVLKNIADFGAKIPEPEEAEKNIPTGPPSVLKDVDLNLSYIINLVLPKTDDIAVFNAIFRALRENLLRR